MHAQARMRVYARFSLAHFVGIVHKVAAHRESNSLGFCFVGTLCGDKVSIC
jgi:hypothetical protein